MGPSPVEAANFSESTRIGMLVVKRAVFQSVASMCVHVPPFFSRIPRDKNVFLMSAFLVSGLSPHSQFIPLSDAPSRCSRASRIPGSNCGARRSPASRLSPGCLSFSTTPLNVLRISLLNGWRNN